MKKILIILLMAVSNFSFSQLKFVLEGKVQDTSKKKIYLEIRDDYSLNPSIKFDSCIIKNGIFKFSGEIKRKSEIANLSFKNKTQFDTNKFYFILDGGLNAVTINIPEINSENLYTKSKRPESLSNEVFNKIDSLHQYYFQKYATEAKSWDTKNPEKTTIIKILNDRKISDNLKKEQLKIIKHYPNSFFSLIFLYIVLHQHPYIKDPSELVGIFDNLDDIIKNDPLGNEFIKECRNIIKAERQSSTLQTVPVFEIKTDKGSLFKNSSLLGKPYLIAFSATWCAPCKEMEPKLKAFYNTYKNYGFEIVYFNLDDNDKKWKEHIKKNQLDWINVSDGLKAGTSPIPKQFNVTGIPHYLIVDKTGTIIYNSKSPYDEGFEMLEKYILKSLR